MWSPSGKSQIHPRYVGNSNVKVVFSINPSHLDPYRKTLYLMLYAVPLTLEIRDLTSLETCIVILRSPVTYTFNTFMYRVYVTRGRQYI